MRLVSPLLPAHPVEVIDHSGEFEALLVSRTLGSDIEDAELADLIELDGRWRLERGLVCDLARYRRAVPDLAARPISLDAAIDVSLRSLARADGCAGPEDRHAQRLLGLYPDLEGPIRVAALLGDRMLSTGGVGPTPTKHRDIKLPRSIGPLVGEEGGAGRPRYELLQRLGEGRSGRVYEAVDHLLSDKGHPAKVAVKLIPVDPATLQRQAAEATKARRIEHPAVARVLDRGITEDGDLYLVYELVAGGDLQRWFESRSSRVGLREAARMVRDVARGVQAAHSVGLVHCDLKPSNVLLSPEGQPRVSDFGVAAFADRTPAGTEGRPSSHLPVGNLAFAAPEQLRQSGRAASPMVDIYALGGLLYYLSTGRFANGETIGAILRSRIDVPPMRALRSDVDERLERICARALAARPEDRYPTAAELAADLDSWLDGRPIGWMHEGSWTRLRLWTRRNKGLALVCGLCILLVLGGTFVSGYYARSAQAEAERARELDKTVAISRDKIRAMLIWFKDRRSAGEKPSLEEMYRQVTELVKPDAGAQPDPAKRK